jgi:hypothetical protein
MAMTKKLNKTERQALEEAERKAFLDEYKALIEPLQDKHSMRIIPVVINLSTEAKVHYEAAFAVQRFNKIDAKYIKADENLESQPEANGHTDSDNKAS